MCTEGRGKTEAAQKAAGASEASLPTLPQKLAATARPGTMETPHSAQTSQHGGKSPVLSVLDVGNMRSAFSWIRPAVNSPAPAGAVSSLPLTLKSFWKMSLLQETAALLALCSRTGFHKSITISNKRRCFDLRGQMQGVKHAADFNNKKSGLF